LAEALLARGTLSGEQIFELAAQFVSVVASPRTATPWATW
jgi:hypothetical protein